MANAATRINVARRRKDLRRKIEYRPSVLAVRVFFWRTRGGRRRGGDGRFRLPNLEPRYLAASSRFQMAGIKGRGIKIIGRMRMDV